MNIGFIGLGKMGLPMAIRLLGAGHRVKGLRREERPEHRRVIAAGGSLVGTPREAATDSEMVFLMHPSPKEIAEVIQGNDEERAMKKPPLLLASASPRRAEIMQALGIRFSTMSTQTDEAVRKGEAPAAHVRRLAQEKAIAGRIARPHSAAIIVGADTVVAVRRRILGKPSSPSDAERMLSLLSGKSHEVFTGVALLDGSTGRMITGVETTHVIFRKLSQVEIAAYVRTGEPMDKAGAYAIQGGAAVFIDRIEGNYLNVVGFPVNLFLRLYRNLTGNETARK